VGNIKPKNEWLHKVKWDLVVFDEYHFGAWRETAKELFEGEDDAVAMKETRAEYAVGLEEVNEDLGMLSEKETEFLPITTKAYLYLSGTPFKALATGEFIEEQIFNWTYTDEQRAKEKLAAKNPSKWNPYGALPQMRLLTYQMPDELLAIAFAAFLGPGIGKVISSGALAAAALNSKGAAFSIDRSKPLTINWTGSGLDQVYIIGSSSLVVGKDATNTNIIHLATFTCQVPAAPGGYTIPTEVLAYLLPGSIDAASLAKGSTILAVQTVTAQQFNLTQVSGGPVAWAGMSATLGYSRNLAVQ
jgi:hypothetical protein